MNPQHGKPAMQGISTASCKIQFNKQCSCLIISRCIGVLHKRVREPYGIGTTWTLVHDCACTVRTCMFR